MCVCEKKGHMVQWLLALEINLATLFQILNKAVCISHSPIDFEKGINPTIPPPSIGK